MERFNLNGHLVKVDVQMTKKLYEPFPLVSDESKCKCDDCRYYEYITSDSKIFSEVWN